MFWNFCEYDKTKYKSHHLPLVSRPPVGGGRIAAAAAAAAAAAPPVSTASA